MPTISETIASIEVEKEAVARARDRATAEVEHILATAQQEGRANLTKEEDQRVTELFEKRDQAKKDLKGVERKLEAAQRARAEELENEKADREVRSTNAARPAYDGVARVGREERTYNPQADRRGAQFLRDVARQFLYNDLQAGHRLSRHMDEERVERAQYLTRAAGDANTGAFTGLTVPQYLTEMYAPKAAAMRPFADVCNKHDLPPDGMTVNISRITTSSTVALQANELDPASPTSMDDTLLTINVQTAAGQQTLSRQAIDRGTGIEDVTMNDLFRQYATTLDGTLINQASTGLSAASTNIDWSGATPLATELYAKIAAGGSGVETSVLGLAVPSHVVMHPRRWYWLQAALTSTWPLINQPGYPTDVAGTNNAQPYGSNIRGQLPNGMGAVVDANVTAVSGTATNQDEVYVIAADECHLWEDSAAPVFIRAEQAKAANLGVLMVLYGYFAYTFQRFSGGTQKITGTKLLTPTF